MKILLDHNAVAGEDLLGVATQLKKFEVANVLMDEIPTAAASKSAKVRNPHGYTCAKFDSFWCNNQERLRSVIKNQKRRSQIRMMHLIPGSGDQSLRLGYAETF